MALRWERKLNSFGEEPPNKRYRRDSIFLKQRHSISSDAGRAPQLKAVVRLLL